LFEAILRREEEISFENFKEHRSRIKVERSMLKTTADFMTQRKHLVKPIRDSFAVEKTYMLEGGCAL